MNNELLAQLLLAMPEAQEDRDIIYTYDETSMTQKYGGQVSVFGGDEDGSYIQVTKGGASVGVSVNTSDLVRIAAHCLAAAQEIIDSTPTQ